MQINKESHIIELKDNAKINVDIRYPIDQKSLSLVVFCHGFKGYKDWGFIPYFCERLAESSMISVNFDFSYNGKSSGRENLYDAEVFSKNTISREVSDLCAVVDFLMSNIHIQSITNNQLILVGHSLGGAIAILSTKYICNINKIILIASISNCNRYTPRQSALWKVTGKLEFEIYDTKQKLYIDRAFLDDIEENYPSDILCSILSKLDIPVFIVHGTEDLSVKIHEAEKLLNSARKANHLFMPKTGHSFGVPSNFVKTNLQLEKLINESINFIQESNV